MGKSTPAPDAVGEHELVATRTFDAPRDLVFQMFSEPGHITHWWGPRGLSTTTSEMDFRPGGVWRHVMHGPDGVDYPNEVVYLEIVRPERLVYDHVSAPRFQSTITFDQEGDKTRVCIRMVYASGELLDFVIRRHGADKGLEDTLARLGEYLARR